MMKEASGKQLHSLEIALIEACNMNCKGCSHFSTLATMYDQETLDEYEKDLSRMKELFPAIGTIRLHGGEPLLNPDVEAMLKLTKQYYGDSKIRIVTNGLYIPSISESLLRFMAVNDIGFDISLYETTAKLMYAIKIRLADAGVRFAVSKGRSSYDKRIDLSGRQDVHAAYARCDAKKMGNYLYKGMLSGCFMPSAARLYDRRYNTRISSQTDLINIHDTALSKDEIYMKLNSPLETCKHCTSPVSLAWERANGEPAMEDWLVQV